MYKPAIQNTPRHWANRVFKTCKARPRVILGIVVSILFFMYFRLELGRKKEVVVERYTPVVLVMVLPRTDTTGEPVRILDKVLENRHEYAVAHSMFFFAIELTTDYELAVFNASDYAPMFAENEQTWVKLAALRDAMDWYPHAEWFWYLDQVSPFQFPFSNLAERNYNEPYHPIT